MTNFRGGYSFYPTRKIKVRKDKLSEYLELTEKADKSIEASETGFYIIIMIRAQKIIFALSGQRLIKIMMFILLI